MTVPSASLSLIVVVFFFCFLFPLFSISDAIVPAADTFRYVNSGDFGLLETEYNPTYRFLPPFTTPFQLCFYNTTPNAYTLSLRMGTRRDGSIMPWVWEANRGKPVRENATFSFGSDGNLVLADADGRIVWQTNTANKGVVGFAILSNGNMVLRDAKGSFIWQSFDSPTDTLLLGQSLQIGGPNKLVSRASTTENVNGVYSFVLEPKRMALYYKTMLYWSSTFTEVNKANGNLVKATLQIVETEYDDDYFHSLRCHLSNSNEVSDLNLDIIRYNSNLSYLRLGVDGNLRLYTYRANVRGNAWSLLFTLFKRGVAERRSMEGECQLPERCGKFGLCEDSQCVACPTPNGLSGWSKDCDSKKVTTCKSGEFGYYKLEGVDHFMIKYTRGDGPIKQTECETKCSKDCKCVGYFYHTDRSRCWIAYDLKTLTRVGNSTNLAYIKTPK
ncbi:epidermis-specific secreted glycoprotein EP1-like [Cynara cardunculus var. scolymus]|uniref:epidermis-specific secreted glycoprotein EP1-like n=1 Tax=Cynara cardunculus var. scolymus TaxID=59895 RepID=UPI000D628C11|nr:epidermis-specific secreted glycoprotein EP1-like [Cynara cardunculus var. scolymus]